MVKIEKESLRNLMHTKILKLEALNKEYRLAQLFGNIVVARMHLLGSKLWNILVFNRLRS